MSELRRVARLSEIRKGQGKFTRIDDDEIALFNVEGRVYAIGNVCAHQHISALHQGELNGLTITCPMHGWAYSLETGKAVAGNGCVKTYPAKIIGENVFIEVS